MRVDKRYCIYHKDFILTKRKRQRRFLSLTGFTPLEILGRGRRVVVMNKQGCKHHMNVIGLRRKRQRRFLSLTGFTVIELLAVIAIILVIVGIGARAYYSWRERAEIAKTRATVVKIEMALEMYKSDYGVYPPEGAELNNPTNPKLKIFLSGYMNFKGEDMASGNPPVKDPNGNILLDPWGKYYIVLADHDNDPSTVGGVNHWKNRSTSYIYSWGPDGKESHASYEHDDNLDNIDNYKPML